MKDNFDFCQAGIETLQIEKEAIEHLQRYIDKDFATACQIILAAEGKVVVMGVGKSGHIGKKIAATFASTGTPAFFVHPGEASHGDLGMIEKNDVILAISNSGEASEIATLLPVFKRRNITLISMTNNPKSTIATLAKVNLCIEVPKEACPIGLAPTSSSTATLVMGDALAVALMRARRFTADDFALSHPGGLLGRKLLLRISDVMHKGDALPQVFTDCTIRDALLEISEKGLGMTAVVEKNGELCGIFTDGDLRRTLDKRIDIHNTPIGDVMGKNPATIGAQVLAAEGLQLMESKKINGLLVVEHNKLIGALNMHDLLRAGVI
ncbi:MAG: KpsF/GutQ family sugar-phosphate isomerase [Vibrionaceae bacterium]